MPCCTAALMSPDAVPLVHAPRLKASHAHPLLQVALTRVARLGANIVTVIHQACQG